MLVVGRITKDAVVQQLKDERKVVNFTVAVNDFYKPKNSSDGKQVTLYISCSYWISTKIAEKLTKGSLVELYGRLYVSAYNDLQGEARATLYCHVNTIKLHGKGAPSKEQASAEKERLMEDLPF